MNSTLSTPNTRILDEADATVDLEMGRIAQRELMEARRRYVAPQSRVAKDGAERYSHEVARHKVMPYELQARLVRMSRDERVPAEIRRGMSDLVSMSNQRIVIAEARKFFGRGLTPEALIQAGNEGMMEAIAQFKDGKGANFVTFAKQKIRMRMGRACENGSAAKHGARLPVDFYNFVYATVQRAVRALEAEGVDPTLEELHSRVAVTVRLENESREGSDKPIKPIPTQQAVSDGYSWLTGRRPVSLQSTVGDDDGSAELGAVLEGDRSVEGEVFNEIAGDAIAEAFSTLDEREQQFFGSLVGFGDYPHLPTAAKVAEHYGVSAAEARRVVNGARERVQAALVADGYGR